jgi:hypothetical protein
MERISRNPVHAGAIAVMIAVMLATGCTQAPAVSSSGESSWEEQFNISDCTLVTTGKNRYFILEPGFQLVLESRASAATHEELAITVLDETREVAGVEMRVVEEREWRGGQLIEVSRNFFAMCKRTKDVFYFGEEVDMFRDGEMVSHSGAWLAGRDGARAGLIMPGEPTVGKRYYQEIAPGVAMDRAEVVSLDETLETPAGLFSECLRTKEGTALNPTEQEFKVYAPEIGLIQDANLLLTGYGFVPLPEGAGS